MYINKGRWGKNLRPSLGFWQVQDISAAHAWLVITTNGITISFDDKMKTFPTYWMATPTWELKRK